MIRVIVLDSDKKNLEKCKNALDLVENKNFECSFLDSAADVIELTSKEEISVVISALIMPVMSGAELFETLSIISPSTKLILTAYSNQAVELIDSKNRVPIFRIIMEPWKQSDDLYIPIDEAVLAYLSEKNQEIQNQMIYERDKKLEKLVTELKLFNVTLKNENYQLKELLDNMILTNLHHSKFNLNESEIGTLETFFDDIIKQYLDICVLGVFTLQEIEHTLNSNFQDLSKNQILKFKYQLTNKPTYREIQKITFILSLVLYWNQVQIIGQKNSIVLGEEQGFYTIKVLCEYIENDLCDKNYRKICNPNVRESMEKTIKLLLTHFSSKFSMGTQENTMVYKIFLHRKEN